jgi:crotonobetainyl-CoA:carnitine CoA-transferase CaiB-like acyl-CoA transferase
VRPLEGVRVVELAMWVAGPAVGGILADWGADVIKIEPPGGDPMRTLNQTYSASTEPRTPAFELDNRGKRSIVVDLATPRGVQLLHELIATADVFLTNTRLRSLERMGLDHESLLARHDRLVYALITAHGTEGPARDVPGYEQGAFWAWSGAASRSTPDGEEPRAVAGAAGDHVTAITAVGAVMAGLYARERHGVGQLVTTSLLRAGMYTVSGDIATRMTLGRIGRVTSRRTSRNPLVNPYAAGDGRWFWLQGAEPARHWPNLVRAMDAPELLDDPRFADSTARRRHIDELIPIMDAIFAGRDRDEWAARFAEHDVWWAPVNSMEDLLDDPQVRASNAFLDVRSRVDGEISPAPAGPIDFGSGAARVVVDGPPLVGEHTLDVLDSLGLSAEERNELIRDGIVSTPAAPGAGDQKGPQA